MTLFCTPSFCIFFIFAVVSKVHTCSYLLAPTCGADGNEYHNSCLARKYGGGVAPYDSCEHQQWPHFRRGPSRGYVGSAMPGQCLCPRHYDPVCGTDGRTYNNECMADCNGVGVLYEGRCTMGRVCTCTRIYWPVCATNGRTYNNECLANCAGQHIAYEGPCEGDY